MNRDALIRTLAGAVMAGASLLSGNAALVTVAGGVGVNWASEGLGALWDDQRPPAAHSPLAQAHARALRRAVQRLREEYQRQGDSRSEGRAFALLADSAESLSRGELILPAAPGFAGVEQALAASLPALLHGHDAREVAWLQPRLLPAVARAFRDELARDADARQLFSLLLIEQLARHSQSLGSAAQRLPELLNALATASAQLDAIQRSQATLEALLATRGSGAGGKLTHLSADAHGAGSQARVEVEGEPPATPPVQAGGEVVDKSAIAREGGRATVSIRRATAPPPDTRRPILALFADPAPRLAPLDLLGEIRALEEAIQPHDRAFRLHTIKGATVDDLARHLRDERPHLLHLAGHGSAQGFRLCDERGDEQLVRWQDLADEIASHVPPLRALFIAACHSLAEAEMQRLPFVIALRGPLSDQVSIAFAQGFYEALVAAPDDIPRAHAAGQRRARMKLHCEEEALPRLWVGAGGEGV